MRELIIFRWIAIGCLLLGLIPLLGWGYLDKRHLPYMMAVLILLSIFNIFVKTSVYKTDSSKNNQHSDALVFSHLTIDVLAAVGVLFVSGCAENPFVSMLAIHAFLGGMLLEKKYSRLFLIVVVALLMLLQLETIETGRKTVGFEVSSVAMDFMAQWMFLVASWMVSFYFSENLRKQNKTIQSLREKQFLTDKSKALGALAAGLSHELASPLNVLQLRFERAFRMISENPTFAKEQKVVGEFQAAQIALNSSVDIFSKMKKVFAGQTDINIQSVEVSSFVRKLIHHWQLGHAKVNVSLICENERIQVQTQLMVFSEVLMDVLDNAAEAMNEVGQIEVRVYVKNGFVYFEVIDEGVGLSPEILSRLGEPFATSKIHGNGLGIYSAMLFADNHGGRFDVKNNLGRKGAKATLCLPEEETA